MRTRFLWFWMGLVSLSGCPDNDGNTNPTPTPDGLTGSPTPGLPGGTPTPSYVTTPVPDDPTEEPTAPRTPPPTPPLVSETPGEPTDPGTETAGSPSSPPPTQGATADPTAETEASPTSEATPTRSTPPDATEGAHDTPTPAPSEVPTPPSTPSPTPVPTAIPTPTAAPVVTPSPTTHPDDRDEDGDGFTENEGDCNDSNDQIYPGQSETCDGLDQDCDGVVDEDSTDDVPWYGDNDGDGQGDNSDVVMACAPPAGYVAAFGDCDDDNADVHSGAQESCDGTDHDCDTLVYEPSSQDATTYYTDLDEDGYGATTTSIPACSLPEGYVDVSGDCNDAEPSIHPEAIEICNQIDDDCDGFPDDIPDKPLACLRLWHWHDYSNGSFTSTGGYGYSSLAAWLTTEGITWSENTDTLTDDALSQVDLLFVGYSPRDLTAEEVAAVGRFVQSGGGLFVQDGFTGSSTEYTRHNQFTSQFGLTFGGPLLSGGCTLITPDPTNVGITELRGNGGIPIAVSSGGQASCTTSGGTAYNYSATASAGAGRVAAFFDEWVWFNTSSDYGWLYLQHQTYALNLVRWLGQRP